MSGRADRRWAYAGWGALLSLGAPLGLAIVRGRRTRQRLGFDAVAAEIQSDPATYGYVLTSTFCVFSAWGFLMGRNADALLKLSSTDPLTSLYNGRVFHERLEEEVERAKRYGLPLSLLIVDLDGLKAINDTHGHRAGSAALVRVAHCVREGLRVSDVGARWGGDEFAILAPNTDLASALALAERIRAAVATRTTLLPLGLSVSIGVASRASRQHMPWTAQELLSEADALMYDAKRAGKNRIAFSSQGRGEVQGQVPKGA